MFSYIHGLEVLRKKRMAAPFFSTPSPPPGGFFPFGFEVVLVSPVGYPTPRLFSFLSGMEKWEAPLLPTLPLAPVSPLSLSPQFLSAFSPAFHPRLFMNRLTGLSVLLRK